MAAKMIIENGMGTDVDLDDILDDIDDFSDMECVFDKIHEKMYQK